MAIDWQVETAEELESTQSSVIQRYKDGKVGHGYVLRAVNQTQGRGRHGREWYGAKGNLYFSFIVTPHLTPDKIGHISLLTAVALHRAIVSFIKDIDSSALIKWPNDILINQKKCSGILIETLGVSASGAIEGFVIGIGVNVARATIEGSTALCDYNSEACADDVFSELLTQFSSLYDSWEGCGFENIRQEWLTHTFRSGQKVSVKQGDRIISGAFDTVDLYGNLVILCDQTNEKRTITCGDVFLL